MTDFSCILISVWKSKEKYDMDLEEKVETELTKSSQFHDYTILYVVGKVKDQVMV